MQIFHVYIKINIQRVWKDGIHLVCGWTEKEREIGEKVLWEDDGSDLH